jgi:uncharacterized cupin superfamily protein
MTDSAAALAALLVRNYKDTPLRHGAYGQLFESHTARLIPATEDRGLGAMVVVLPPGKRAVAYHLHHAEDEMYVILEGEGTARIAGELIPVRAGDVVYTPAGRDYPHQIVNTSDKEMRYLSIGTHARADICEYPDSGKFMAYTGGASGVPLVVIQRTDASLPYWDGEPTSDID